MFLWSYGWQNSIAVFLLVSLQFGGSFKLMYKRIFFFFRFYITLQLRNIAGMVVQMQRSCLIHLIMWRYDTIFSIWVYMYAAAHTCTYHQWIVHIMHNAAKLYLINILELSFVYRAFLVLLESSGIFLLFLISLVAIF